MIEKKTTKQIIDDDDVALDVEWVRVKDVKKEMELIRIKFGKEHTGLRFFESFMNYKLSQSSEVSNGKENNTTNL